MSKAMSMSSQGGGHLYIQTNEIRNCVGKVRVLAGDISSPATGAALVESAERHFGGLDKFDSGARWPGFTTQGGGQ